LEDLVAIAGAVADEVDGVAHGGELAGVDGAGGGDREGAGGRAGALPELVAVGGVVGGGVEGGGDGGEGAGGGGAGGGVEGGGGGVRGVEAAAAGIEAGEHGGAAGGPVGLPELEVVGGSLAAKNSVSWTATGVEVIVTLKSRPLRVGCLVTGRKLMVTEALAV